MTVGQRDLISCGSFHIREQNDVCLSILSLKGCLRHHWKEQLNTQQYHYDAGKEQTGKKMPYA